MVNKISKETMHEIIKSIKIEVKLTGAKSESNNFKVSQSNKFRSKLKKNCSF